MTAFDDNEITARLHVSKLTEAHEERRKATPGRSLRVTISARTDLGRMRENNEDKFDFLIPEDAETLANNGALYAVADGMGGHAAGQIASELALKTLIRAYYSVISGNVKELLRAAVYEANSMVYDTARMIPDRAGMGTTLVLAVVREQDLFVAHVGDSRAYLLRDGKISRLTRDHSWVEEQVSRGALSEEDAHQSPFRNVITRSLGIQPTVEPDISAHQLAQGDRVLLCSDGLTGYLSDSDLLDIATKGSPSQAALELVEAANERGGQDNITVFILQIEKIREETEHSTASFQKETTPDRPSGWLERALKRKKG